MIKLFFCQYKNSSEKIYIWYTLLCYTYKYTFLSIRCVIVIGNAYFRIQNSNPSDKKMRAPTINNNSFYWLSSYSKQRCNIVWRRSRSRQLWMPVPEIRQSTADTNRAAKRYSINILLFHFGIGKHQKQIQISLPLNTRTEIYSSY